MKNTVFLSSRTSLLLVGFLAASSLGWAQQKMQSAGPGDQSRLVRAVREATRQYLDVDLALKDGYAPFLGCVTGSDHGAMGVHYVNGNLINGTIDVNHPQALIYEPSPNGQMRLVGVEFITYASTWLQNNTNPPVLQDQVFLYVDSPNRFNIPAFFELHVWAWRDNPQGDFVDWNDHVSCAKDN
ncbi:MAG TPA: hypothetical protein VND65_19715 [Candidatus Binatia bacterium]|nr:hypothetical protein [Candidatus Binatia bacterium]